MTHFTPFSALIGGALIGLSSALLLLHQGRVAGISGIIDASLAEPRRNLTWRIPFLLGLVVIGFLATLLAPQTLGSATGGYARIAIAGILVGFGTRLGNGCTSGHGISGLSRLSKRSAVATATFMAAGMITTYVVLHFRGGL